MGQSSTGAQSDNMVSWDIVLPVLLCLWLHCPMDAALSSDGQEPTSFGSLLGQISQNNRLPKSAKIDDNIILSQQNTSPIVAQVAGGVDFSQATLTEDGRLCVFKEDTISTLSKDPILDCSHSSVEKCHLTYVTKFAPSQEEDCSEIFEKRCQITFRKEISTETMMRCMTPLETVCNGQGPEECKTFSQSSCTTRYKESAPGQFIADTKCEKIPREICGEGCIVEEAPEECHEKLVNTLIDVPEEVCDITPQETCQLVTKLVPRLKPIKECTIVPKEVCHLKFSQPMIVEKPLRTEWCKDGMNEDSGNDVNRESIVPIIISQELLPPSVAPSSSYLAESSPPTSSYSALRTTDLVNAIRRLRSVGINI